MASLHLAEEGVGCFARDNPMSVRQLACPPLSLASKDQGVKGGEDRV